MTMLNGPFYTFFSPFFDLPYAIKKSLVRHRMKKLWPYLLSTKGSILNVCKKIDHMNNLKE